MAVEAFKWIAPDGASARDAAGEHVNICSLEN
jgi:hypothetical protein